MAWWGVAEAYWGSPKAGGMLPASLEKRPSSMDLDGRRRGDVPVSDAVWMESGSSSMSSSEE